MYLPKYWPQGTTARVGRAKSQAFKVQQGRTYWLPGFEGFCGGSWWDVDIVEQRDKYYLVKYHSNGADEDDSWLPLNHLRLRTRRADDWDCHILKSGMDISVVGMDSDHEDLVFHPKALYDAKVIRLSRVPHDTRCTCRFFVKLYSLRDEEEPSQDRTLLSHSSATREICISNVSILQQPVNLTCEKILKSHIYERWLLDKWTNDAYFLGETKLTVEGDPMDTRLVNVAFRREKAGVSQPPSRGPTSVLYGTEENPFCKGKAHSYPRDSFDQKHQFDATRGVNHEEQDLEPDVGARNDVSPDMSEEIDIGFDTSDQRGSKTRGSRKDPQCAVDMGHDIGKRGVGARGDGRGYEESRSGSEAYGVNVVCGGEENDEFVVKVKPDYPSRDGVRSGHDDLDVEGRGKSGRGDFVEDAVNSRGNTMDADDKVKILHQSRTELSSEVEVRPVREAEGDVVASRTKKRTGRRHRSSQEDENSRKRRKGKIIIDSSSSGEESEYVIAESDSSDKSSDDRTRRSKLSKYSRNMKHNPNVSVEVPVTARKVLRRGKPSKTRKKDETHDEDICIVDTGHKACGAETIQRGGKTPSQVKARKTSPSTKHERIPAEADQKLVREDKDKGAESASQPARKRGRPRKNTIMTIGERTGKQDRKNSAYREDPSVKRKSAKEVKEKDVNFKPKTSPEIKASLVIDLEDGDCYEIKGDAPIKAGSLRTDRSMRRLRDTKAIKSKLGGEKPVRDVKSLDAPDVILPGRLRSQKTEKKKVSPGCSDSKQGDGEAQIPDLHEAQIPDVHTLEQRPLYLDVLSVSSHGESRSEGDADIGKLSRKHGRDDSEAGPAISKYTVSICEKKHAVVSLVEQSTKPSERRGSDITTKSGSASEIQTGGVMNVEPVFVDKVGESISGAVAEHTAIDEHRLPAKSNEAIPRHPTVDEDRLPENTNEAVVEHAIVDEHMGLEQSNEAVAEHATMDEHRLPENTNEAVAGHPVVDEERLLENTNQAVAEHERLQ